MDQHKAAKQEFWTTRTPIASITQHHDCSMAYLRLKTYLYWVLMSEMHLLRHHHRSKASTSYLIELFTNGGKQKDSNRSSPGKSFLSCARCKDILNLRDCGRNTLIESSESMVLSPLFTSLACILDMFAERDASSKGKWMTLPLQRRMKRLQSNSLTSLMTSSQCQ
jgi:hypothetical protein